MKLSMKTVAFNICIQSAPVNADAGITNTVFTQTVWLFVSSVWINLLQQLGAKLSFAERKLSKPYLYSQDKQCFLTHLFIIYIHLNAIQDIPKWKQLYDMFSMEVKLTLRHTSTLLVTWEEYGNHTPLPTQHICSHTTYMLTYYYLHKCFSFVRFSQMCNLSYNGPTLLLAFINFQKINSFNCEREIYDHWRSSYEDDLPATS